MAARGFRLVAGAAALLALAACEVPPTADGGPAAGSPSGPPAAPPSAESLEIRAYFARVERAMLQQGILRTDAGDDVPVSATQLADNFMAIALYDELVAEGGRYVARVRESELRRWGGPIRMRLVFGPSVDPARQAADRRNVEAYARRLSRLTGVPIRQTGGADANFDVLFLSEDERRNAGPLLRTLVPNISGAAVTTIETMTRDTYCMVFAFSEGPSEIYTRALAIVRDEHPETFRLACIHEELAQAMGLPNDSPEARPSIFNDDDEFAVLTRHDELLLRMLYDPRLTPGMTPDEARPVVREIAGELVGGES